MPTFPTPRSVYFGEPPTPGHEPDKNDIVRLWENSELGSVVFDNVAALKASTSTFADGTIIRTREEGFAYRVDSTATSGFIENSATTAQKLVPLPLAGGGVDVKSFGAVGDGVTDDRGAFLKAFQAGGRDGHKIYVPKGEYYFASTLVLSEATLGFTWRNLYMEMETTASPFQNDPFSDWMPTNILVDGTDAVKIFLEGFGHERIDFQNFTAANKTGTSPGSASAVKISVDGSRNYNYPVGWFFDKPSCQNFAAMFSFQGFNMTTQNDRFVGLISIDNLHAWQTEYAFFVDGLYLNYFRSRNSRCHGGGKIRLEDNSGGHFFLDGWHNESTRPARFEVATGALNSFFSMHNMDGETNGDDSSSSAPYPDGLVDVFGSGVISNQHEFIFTGMVRLPGFNELPPTVPAGFAVSNYTQQDIRIIPKGCTIRTPQSVRIVAPDASGSSSDRHFRFFVPIDKARHLVGERFVAWPGSGRRATFATANEFKRAKQWPGFEAEDKVTRATDFTGRQSGPLFACAHVMDMSRPNTKPWGSPLPSSINGTAQSHSLSGELAKGPHLCVYGMAMGSDTLDSFEPGAPDNPGPDWVTSPAVIFFQEDETLASDYFFPQGYAQTFEEDCPASDQIDIRVSGTDRSSPTYGMSGTIKVDINNGLGGSGKWRFSMTSSGATADQEYNSTEVDLTLSTPTVSNADLINVRLANNTASAVTARATITFE